MTEFEEKYLEELKKQNDEYLDYLKGLERKEEEKQKAVTKYGLFLVGLIVVPLLLFLPVLLQI